MAAVEGQLRGVLLKLQYADAYLRRLPPGCTFEVVAYTTGGRSCAGALPLAAWVEEQPRGGNLELAQVAVGCSGQDVPMQMADTHARCLCGPCTPKISSR